MHERVLDGGSGRPGQWCPHCGTFHPYPPGRSSQPSAGGMLSVCVGCLAAVQVTRGLWFEKVSELVLPTPALNEIEQLRAQIRAARAAS